MAAKAQGSRFIVDLGSIKLPTIVEKQVETDIRSVVLQAMARSDFTGKTRLPSSIFDWFPGRTLGLWLDPELQIPWLAGPLGPSDHTLIMREIMTYPFHILRALGISRGDPKPTGVQVLEAALEVDEIDPVVKERIKAALGVISQLEQADRKPARRTISLVQKAIAEKTIREQVIALRSEQLKADISDDGASDVLNAVAAMLEDGAGSIYSPDLPFYQTISSGTAKKDAVDTIKDADAIGATGGGLVGTLVPGVGTAAGAAAGGAGASAGAAIAKLIDWLW